MVRRVLRHVRRQPVAFAALFVALGGTALAAGPVMKGSPAGGDLTGTYPNPTIASGAVTTNKIADGAVTNAKLANSSLTIGSGTGLTGGGSIPLGGSNTLSIDPTVVQRRVTGACSLGASISSVNQDGSVSCAGAKVIAGHIDADGGVVSGSPFTATHTSSGHYTVSFPAGTWPAPTAPIMTIQPEGLAFVVATIQGETAPLDGSASFNVVLSSTAGSETDQDSAFAFIVTPSST